ncbi:hypothetical protein P691DRAFT_807998 [Macrolepiota fuliginosa MF-IS2]|uniref:Uncharacterized protein n=1 Tax=Macrolepiota fuliginosa MF-IS2 TaxID=1400762 RepID=A0A9P6BZW7_9AGAR|nr:hypothetical protein P691DRAFT_807998 [Macrolepiota fuliginosa MF-IS2]
MTRSVRASLERWTSETPQTISSNKAFLLETFSGLQDLYPELAKYPGDFDPEYLAEQLWIVSLNVFNGILPEDRDDSDKGAPRFYRTLGSKELRMGVEGTGGDDFLADLGLMTFPSSSNPNQAGSNGEMGFDPFAGADMGDIPGANPPQDLKGVSIASAPVADSSKTIPTDPHATPKSGAGLLCFQDAPLLDQISNSAVIEPQFSKRICSLPDLDDEEDLQIDEEVRHRLGNGIQEQHVAGLAFAMPSTIYVPNEEDLYDSNSDDGGGQSSEEEVAAGGLRSSGQGGPKTYDIGILLNLEAVHAQIFESTGLFIAEEQEAQLTQSAIYNLLLDLEPTVVPLGVLQVQVLILPTGGHTHDKIISTFTNMGFKREGKGRIVSYRGFDELTTILTMRTGEWDQYKSDIRGVLRDEPGTLSEFPEGRASERKREGKGKGKGKEREIPLYR